MQCVRARPFDRPLDRVVHNTTPVSAGKLSAKPPSPVAHRRTCNIYTTERARTRRGVIWCRLLPTARNSHQFGPVASDARPDERDDRTRMHVGNIVAVVDGRRRRFWSDVQIPNRKIPEVLGRPGIFGWCVSSDDSVHKSPPQRSHVRSTRARRSTIGFEFRTTVLQLLRLLLSKCHIG